MLTMQNASNPSGARHKTESRLTSLVTLALAAFVFLLAMPVGAQTEAAPPQAAAPPPAAPSINDLKAQAYDAQQAQAEAERAQAEAAQTAKEAEAAHAAAKEQAHEAQRALDSAGATPTPVIVPSGPPPPPAPAPVAAPAGAAAATTTAADAATLAELARTRAELERVTEEAANASAAARAATRALEEHIAERENRYARQGFFLVGGVFWAPDLFNTILTVDSSKGAWAGAGYRFTRRFEAEVRFDWIDGFEVSGFNTVGRVEGWSATANARLFLLTKAFQPYLGVGIGAMQAKTNLKEVGGTGSFYSKDTVALFRPFAGFDYYISETFALTADAAVNLPGGDLTSLTYATISGGVKLRF